MEPRTVTNKNDDTEETKTNIVDDESNRDENDGAHTNTDPDPDHDVDIANPSTTSSLTPPTFTTNCDMDGHLPLHWLQPKDDDSYSYSYS
eukprot:CAMPEP_0168210632 /NCGR_PEP_ID=MMETSP0140_2-20121125/3278_1 /TAXON_ID=44445 /ORGANISM="Pseudo-nitzschia australis, Strain 10249 10 AB" /LENGTH=89 /DNA_ID=CAMNT_0008137255 /DNA_START=80 /DNA_END=346 /DNA_ORIENTATION=+